MFSTSKSNRIAANEDISRNARLFGVNSLIANSVYDAEGNRVGTLEEIVIDARTGCVRHVVLAVGGILGIGRRRIAVPWSALNPDANYRRCVVDVAQMQLTAVGVPDDDPWLQRNYSTQANANYSGQTRAHRPKETFGAHSVSERQLVT
jgi:sporulation protein YlmC with PRC-barrel domain